MSSDSNSASVYAVDKLISEARKLALEYRKATGQPLAGVSGEIAKYDAARLLDLEIVKGQPGGYDAIGHGKREGKRIQIKGRAIIDDKKKGQRIGQLKIEQEWDSVMLVIMDDEFETVDIYEADRADIESAMADQSSKRAKRGAMSVAKFKAISKLVWSSQEGNIDADAWDNQSGY